MSEENRHLDEALTHSHAIWANLVICRVKTNALMLKFQTPQPYCIDDDRQSVTSRSSLIISLGNQDEEDIEHDTMDIRSLPSIKQVNQRSSNLALRALKIRRDVEEVSTRVEHLLQKYGETYLSRISPAKMKARSIFKLRERTSGTSESGHCYCTHVKSTTNIFGLDCVYFDCFIYLFV